MTAADHSWFKRLRLERVRLGLTQASLADYGGVSNATQVAYEGGKTKPSLDYLARVFDAGVDIHYVITGRKQPGISWSLVRDVASAADAWSSSRAVPATIEERVDFMRALYSASEDEGLVDRGLLEAMIRLSK